MTARPDRVAAGRSIAATALVLPPCPVCQASLDEPCQGRPPYGLHAARLRLMGKWPVERFHRLPVAEP